MEPLERSCFPSPARGYAFKTAQERSSPRIPPVRMAAECAVTARSSLGKPPTIPVHADRRVTVQELGLTQIPETHARHSTIDLRYQSNIDDRPRNTFQCVDRGTVCAGDSDEGESRFRRERERHTGPRANSCRSVATLAGRLWNKCSASSRKT